jgi:hypothetical protein
MSTAGKLRSVRNDLLPKRDQETTIFTEILRRLLRATPGARAAALVDFEGETVDYAGVVDPFELRVAAAHWQIVLAKLGASPLGAAKQIVVRSRARSYVVRRLHASYAVVVVLYRHAAFSVSRRALQEADARLCAEAGWPLPEAAFWFSLDVETDPLDPTRPLRINPGDGWYDVEILGCVTDMVRRERGYRVRLACGAEIMLVRECLGRWFTDEHIDLLE